MFWRCNLLFSSICPNIGSPMNEERGLRGGWHTYRCFVTPPRVLSLPVWAQRQGQKNPAEEIRLPPTTTRPLAVCTLRHTSNP